MSEIDEIKMLQKQCGDLDVQVQVFIEQRDTFNSEAKKWREQRDVLNQENSERWNELKIQKSKRDEVNEVVKRLKEQKTEIIVQLKAKRKEALTLSEKVNKLLGRTARSVGSVKNQIEKLDWEIQTNPLSPTEEKEIIEQIRLLERQLLIQKEATGLKDKLIELKAELGVFSIKHKEISNQISEYINKSQEYHTLMLERMTKVRPFKEKADEAHRKYLECRKTANENHSRYLEAIEQIKILNSKIKEIENTKYTERRNKQTETIIEMARKKLKDKKKLTLDEFKLLNEKGLV